MISLNSRAYLKILSEADAEDPNIVETIARWRNKNKEFFFTQFIATTEGTKEWLKAITKDINREFFMIYNKETNKPIGHFGLKGRFDEEVELDAVLRGEKELPGIMTIAVKKILKGVTQPVILNVFQDNIRAIRFYTLLGFKPVELRALVRKTEEGKVIWSFCNELTGIRYALKMRLK